MENEYYRTLIENLNEVVYILNDRAEITYITPNIEAIGGYTVSEVIGRRFTDFVHPDDLPRRMESFGKAFAGSAQATEYRFLTKSGSVVWVRTSARPIREQSRTVGVQGVLNDITDMKRYEHKLEQQFAFSVTLNQILDIIINEDLTESSLYEIVEVLGKTLQLDRALIYEIRYSDRMAAGLCEWLNPEFPEITSTVGTFPMKSFGEGTLDIFRRQQHLESHDDSIHPNLIEGGSADMLHQKMMIKSLLWHPFAFSKDGFYILVFNQVRYRRQWTREELDFLQTINRQVSLAMQKLTFLKEHNQAKEQLYRSEKKFRGIVENAPIGIFQVDSRGIITECNDRFVDIIGSSRARLIKLDTLELPDQKMVSALKTVLTGVRTTYEDDYHSTTADKVTPVKVIFEPIISHKGQVQGAIGIVEDITERRAADNAIKRSLEEKNILLSEIHHRVKNNMAVISSMISLQSDYYNEKKDPGEILKETQSRIRSMALVHELVYENSNFARINVRDLLHQLVSNLKDIFHPDSRNIAVHITSDDILLNMNDSVPFCLLVNEIITNAYKHAFHDRQEGNISLHLHRENGSCKVMIEDDGSGVSDASMLEKPKSLGYTIIQGLIKQLKGTLEISSDLQGLRLDMQFPLNEKKSDTVTKTSNQPVTTNK